jgi:hypothetical protein
MPESSTQSLETPAGQVRVGRRSCSALALPRAHHACALLAAVPGRAGSRGQGEAGAARDDERADEGECEKLVAAFVAEHDTKYPEGEGARDRERQAHDAFRAAGQAREARADGPIESTFATARRYARTSVCFTERPEESTNLLRRALEAAQKAVDVGPEYGEAYSVRGWLRAVFNWEFTQHAGDLAKDPARRPADARDGPTRCGADRAGRGRAASFLAVRRRPGGRPPSRCRPRWGVPGGVLASP